MQFGLLLANQHPPGSMVERFQNTIEQVRLARELGFDLISSGSTSCSTSSRRSSRPSPPPASRPRLARMRSGMTIYLLPLLNPVAVAEEAASLDIITGGRFIFGIGLGYREAEDNAFGLKPGRAGPTLRAHLEVIKKLWSGEPVDFESPYCRLQGATMALRPLQRPHPPIWVAANNDRAVERAAELGRHLEHQPARHAGDDRAPDGAVPGGAGAAGQAVPGRAPDDARDLRGREPRGGAAAGPPEPGAEVQGVRGLGPAAGAPERRRHDPGVRRPGARPVHHRRPRGVRRRDPALHRARSALTR